MGLGHRRGWYPAPRQTVKLAARGNPGGGSSPLSKISIGETGVAKVVPERIYAVAVHPSASSLLVAAGDKVGNLGLWNVDGAAGTETDGVATWQPHTRTVNALQFAPQDPAKLYSSSHDGAVRCMDLSL